MRALQIVEPGTASIVEVDVPEPGPAEVLVKVAGSGVCHSDLHLLHAPKLPSLPLTLGHETAGTIAALGPGVTGFSEGDAVLVYQVWACGACRACAEGADNYCERIPRTGIGILPGLPGARGERHRPGGMAEYQVAPARSLVALVDLDPASAGPLGDAGLTAYHAVDGARSHLTPSSAVLVVGVGGLGHVAVQIVCNTTACRVIATDVSEAKLDLARRLGADDVVPSGPDVAAAVSELTGGRGVDVVFDFVGIEATCRLAVDCVARRGHIAMVGAGGGTLGLTSPPSRLPLGVSASVPFSGGRRDLHEVLALARGGELTLEVEHHPLDDALRVFDRLEAGEVMGRAVLVP